MMAGVQVDCLLDTGSQVTLVNESFYLEHFEPLDHQRHTVRNWLTIQAADGLELPYLGYFETDIMLSGVTVNNRAVLVVLDCSYGHKVPSLIGMNVPEGIEDEGTGCQ